MDWWTGFDKKMADYLPDLRIVKEEPMSRHTSFRIGGPARRMAFPASGAQLVLLLSFAAECGARPLVIGRAPTCCARTRAWTGWWWRPPALPGWSWARSRTRSWRRLGVSLARLGEFACQQGLTGLEFAHGIPGSVGGGLVHDAGAYGGEMKQVVSGVSVLFPEEGIPVPHRGGDVLRATAGAC